jgi:hypothetical protein
MRCEAAALSIVMGVIVTNVTNTPLNKSIVLKRHAPLAQFVTISFKSVDPGP